jgi:hypothetical protein
MTTLVIVLCVLLVAGAAGYTAIEVAKLKYRESAELGVLKAEVTELRQILKKIDVKELRERVVALENRAGVRMY